MEDKNQGLKKSKKLKAFIDHLQAIDDVYENLEDFDPTKKRRVIGDLIADVEVNKKLSPTLNELFLRGGKLKISLVFISQSFFKVPKTRRHNTLFYHENT